MSDRDLVEAGRSERRRVAAALVTGRASASLPRPVRPVVGGLLVALVVAGAAAVAGAVAPRAPDGWADGGLVLPEGEPALHVVADGLPGPPGALHPVAGPLSAALVVGHDATPVDLPGDVAADVRRGPEVGIAGAPALAPDASSLATVWMACPGGAPAPLPPATVARPGTATSSPVVVSTVRHRGGTWLVGTDDAGELVATAVPGAPAVRDALLAAVGAPPRAGAPTVPAGWTALLPRTAPLSADVLTVAGAGEPAPYADDPGVDLPPDARLGDHLPDVRGGGAVLTAAGLRRLDPFAYAAYVAVAGGAGAAVRELPPDASPGVADAPTPGTGWPSALPTAVEAPPCAVLDTATGEVRPAPVAALDAGVGGAGLAADGDAVWLVTGGRRHLLVDDAASRLGYDASAAPTVPRAWLRAVPRGVPLSPAAAHCPPDPGSPTGSRCPGTTTPRSAATGASGGGG